MKKLLFALLMGLVINFSVVGQSTPALELRVALATTTFGVNVPIGTKVYNVGDGKYWVATAAVASTATLTTAAASFTQLNPTAVDGSVSNEGSLTVGAGTATTSIINSNTSGSMGVTLEAGSGIGIAEIGNVITVTNTAQNTDAQTLTYTPAARTIAISGGNSQTIPLANGTEINPGLITKADYDIFKSLSNHVYKVESFAEAAAGVQGQTNTLSNTPLASTSVLVSLNGVELKATQYTVATNTVKVTIPVYQYDAISIAYTY